MLAFGSKALNSPVVELMPFRNVSRTLHRSELYHGIASHLTAQPHANINAMILIGKPFSRFCDALAVASSMAECGVGLLARTEWPDLPGE
jgi:hypothetical protein